MKKRHQSGMNLPWRKITISILFVLLLSFGTLQSVGYSSSTIDRPSNGGVVSDTNSDAILQIDTVSQIESNSTSQFATVSNSIDRSVSVSIELSSDAQSVVSFQSSADVSTVDGGDIAEFDLQPGDSVTLYVEVDEGASSEINTADFSASGDSETMSFELNERTGPDVV
jgi:hypothetical protein